MRKPGSKAVVIIFLLWSLLAAKESKASHCAGGELIYEWVSDSTYRFFLKFYRDCTGAKMSDSVQLCVKQSCNNTWNNSGPGGFDRIFLKKWTGGLPGGRKNGDALSVGCAQYPTKCDLPSSVVPGYEEYWFSKTITMPGRCADWTFSVSLSARNPSENIIAQGASNWGNMYLQATLNNLLFEGNSSPEFTTLPIPYLCINSPFSYNTGAIDRDNDSLVVDIVQPQTGTCGSFFPVYAPMQPGIQFPSNPLSCNNTFIMNQQSGQFTFTPDLLGAHAITTRVREYRNGVMIGEVLRDVQLQVLTCNTIPVAAELSESSFVNATLNKTGIISTDCGNDFISFCFDIKAGEKDALLKVYDNHEISTPGATLTYVNNESDSVRGCFSWHVTDKDTGNKTLVISVKDSTCRPPGFIFDQAFSFFLKIRQVTNPPYVYVTIASGKDTICELDTIIVINADTNSGSITNAWDITPDGFVEGNNPFYLSWNSPGIKHALLTVSNDKCESRDSLDIYVKLAPKADFVIKENACVNEAVAVKMTYSPGARYYWTIDESSQDNHEFIDSFALKWGKKGDKKIKISVDGRNGCKAAVFSDTIHIRQPASEILDLIEESYCMGDTIGLHAWEEKGNTYEWWPADKFDDPYQPKVMFCSKQPVDIGVNVTDIWGCVTKYGQTMGLGACCKVYFPDAFSPNGDGHNDIFKMLGRGHHTVKTFIVKNRWGQTLFETSNQSDGWDGLFKGTQQDPGSYVYYLDYVCADGVTRLSKKGTFLLVR